MFSTKEECTKHRELIENMYDLTDTLTSKPIFKTRILTWMLLDIKKGTLVLLPEEKQTVLDEVKHLRKCNEWDYKTESELLKEREKLEQIQESLKLMTPEERAIYHKKRTESTDKLIKEITDDPNFKLIEKCYTKQK